MLLAERQKFNKQITEYEKVINDYNADFFKASDDLDNIVKPLLMRLELNRDLCQGQLPFLIGNL